MSISQLNESKKHNIKNQIINQTFKKEEEEKTQTKLHERRTESSMNKEQEIMRIFNYTKITEKD